jgi:isopenicillin N synthase-like dioxygenase
VLIIHTPGLEEPLSNLYRLWRPAFTDSGPTGLAISEIGSEQAIGAPRPDSKRCFDFSPDSTASTDPLLAATAAVHEHMMSSLRTHVDVIARAIPTHSELLTSLLGRAPPPVLRISYYPGDRRRLIANYSHKDIDLVTLIPRATVPGLQVLRDKEWLDLNLNENYILILSGEMLQFLGGPNGYIHRVIGNRERLSVSLFVNANPDELLPNGERAGAVVNRRLRQIHQKGQH